MPQQSSPPSHASYHPRDGVRLVAHVCQQNREFFSAILRKFRAPIVIGPGHSSDWGFKEDSPFDELGRQATAAFEAQGIPVISPRQYGEMERISSTNVHFKNNAANVTLMGHVCTASLRVATLCSILRGRALHGVLISAQDREFWHSPPPLSVGERDPVRAAADAMEVLDHASHKASVDLAVNEISEEIRKSRAYAEEAYTMSDQVEGLVSTEYIASGDGRN